MGRIGAIILEAYIDRGKCGDRDSVLVFSMCPNHVLRCSIGLRAMSVDLCPTADVLGGLLKDMLALSQPDLLGIRVQLTAAMTAGRLDWTEMPGRPTDTANITMWPCNLIDVVRWRTSKVCVMDGVAS